ncbi:MAG: T9SS type A sorting domain-containing protein [candidate division Zixibacteria bacterium]
MKKMLLLALAVLLTFGLATAQTTKIVIGPLDGEDAGAIVADTNEVIEIQIWVRTAPGINIVGLHLPLASKNEYIQGDSRVEGEVFYPLPLWDDQSFLDPNEDSQNDGYSNHSYLAIKDFGAEDPDSINAIKSDGYFSQIMFYTMTTADSGYGFPHDDAFMIGTQDDNGGMVWVDFLTGEMDNDDIEVSIATLELPATTDIDDEIEIPNSFSMSQNYPNPFNASTTINYSLPEGSYVTIDVYDIIGRKIKTLVSGHQNAGEHSVVWNADNVSSGVYFYRISSDDYSQTRRCNLLK